MGVLEPVQVSPSFVSKMFLIPKDDGSSRPIFNLQNLNNFVHQSKFRLINLQKVPSFLQANDWLAKIDILNAYFHLSVSPRHRRFLRLIFNKELLQMTCLPFGLSSAPRVFASVTNWVAQLLRNQGIRVLVYLDDFLLAHQDMSALQHHINLTINLLRSLGWHVNLIKSNLSPQKEVQYLGILWNPSQNVKKLPIKKHLVLGETIKKILKRSFTNRKEIQSLIGMLNFASFAVPYGRLNYRQVLSFFQRLPDSDPLRYHPLPQVVISNLTWWLSNLKESSPIHPPLTSHYLTTDASGSGSGSILDNTKLVGTWSAQEIPCHSNMKEMFAILNVLRDHCHILANSTVSIQSDNKTVLSYLRNQGGTRSSQLMAVTFQIYQILQEHKIHLSLHHLPGRFNVEADHLSRNCHYPEWHLLPVFTKIIFAKWGLPIIDLFASRRAHVVPRYVTLDQTDDQAVFVDAFSRPWNYSLAWVFPPPFLMPKVLAHLNVSKGRFLIVAPRWEKSYWRTDLKNRALAAPFTVYNLNKVMIDVLTNRPPPKVLELTLEIWICGAGNQC
ncbi:unnamed protein product [Plutella xylostella]|uniref:(diamondback moth) hypothetical protein n=1 Tax=Plutella xylostella TaxID=51655 RepID=A0A8S4F9F2_PLUXY|nr:unnamed protein product [Plutella xylostella]